MGATGAGSKVCLTRLRSLALGGFETKDISAIVFEPHFRERAGVSVDGFIGSNFLRFFKVRIDSRRKLLTLSHDTTPPRPVPGGTIVKIGQDYGNMHSFRRLESGAGTQASSPRWTPVYTIRCRFREHF